MLQNKFVEKIVMCFVATILEHLSQSELLLNGLRDFLYNSRILILVIDIALPHHHIFPRKIVFLSKTRI